MYLQKIKLLNNNILLKPRMNNDRIILKNGIDLYIDTSFLEMEHTNIICDVINVPNKITHKDKEGNIIEYPLEVQIGDVAYCHYLAIQNSLKRKYDGRSFIYNNEVYVIISYYQNIFMVIRSGSPIMVNDYILIEPSFRELKEIKEKFKRIDVEIPQQTIDYYQNNTRFGYVRLFGEDLSQGEGFSNKDLVDQEVLFQKHADIPLEYDIHQTFMKGKKLYRILRKNILMIMDC